MGFLLESDFDTGIRNGKKSSITPNHAFVFSYMKLASISLFFILYHYLHYFYYL